MRTRESWDRLEYVSVYDGVCIWRYGALEMEAKIIRDWKYVNYDDSI